MIVTIQPIKGRNNLAQGLKKMNGEYVSGYLCNHEKALKDFEETRNLVKDFPSDKSRSTEVETVAYRVIQSFPPELNISDEEVHQCGMELLQKIEKHQGVVCTQARLLDDEDSEKRVDYKYNRIIFNAYILPEKLDTEHPRRRKYNDCTRTYWQLKAWNDEIALAHNLPIVQKAK